MISCVKKEMKISESHKNRHKQMGAYGACSLLNSAQRGASIGHLLNDTCMKTLENMRIAKISREMVAMPTNTKQ